MVKELRGTMQRMMIGEGNCDRVNYRDTTRLRIY